MKVKIIGAAVTAALLGLSGVAVAQGTGAAGASGPSGQDSARDASRAASGADRTTGSVGAPVTSGSGSAVTSGSATTTAPATTTGTASRCDTLTGADKTRCMRDERASSGTSTTPGVPVTGKPGDSGVGAIDKTRPGAEPAGTNQAHPRDAGTSSAGGPGGK